jgi:N-acetylneuraminic acid mutarotase
MNRKTLLFIAVLASAALSAHAQNLVVNPGFETGDFTGWTASHCQVNGNYVHSGRYAADLVCIPIVCPFGCGGGLDQTITTVAGQLYHVDFWLDNHNGVPPSQNGFSASFAGVTILSLVNSPSFPYTHFSGNVAATSTSSLLHFGYHYGCHIFGQPGGGWDLDDVSVTPCASVGSWTEQAPYPIVISGNTVASQGGNVYSFGGIANNTAIANAYKYTPATNTWTPIASLPAPRGWFSATSDGTYIYLLGGVDQNFNTTATLWRYDPATNGYNTSLPSYTIPTYFHASAYLNGKIYRIAGAAIGTDFHVEVYDIATNSWSMAANYPFANHNLMAAALGSYIYAGGGNASPDKTYRYDPSTDTWDDASIADLPAGRSSAASGAYNGRWLLAGGDVNFAISNSVIAWDPATNTWSNLPNMVQARDNLEGATAGQSFYAVAGDSGPGTPTNDNQQYTETCATPTPTPSPTPTPTVTPTATPTPTSTPRVMPRPRPTPVPRPTP